MRACILAAGRGTRSRMFGGHLHKSLLPLGNRAVISHILDQFPHGTSFVVALGHQAHQVRSYLELAHADLDIDFVLVDNYDGVGSGPGYSLWCCRDRLQEPFCFTACDTLVVGRLPQPGRSWIGVSEIERPERWCTVEVDSTGLVGALHYKSPSGTRVAFNGIASVNEPMRFWNGLAEGQVAMGEWQVNSGLEALIPTGLQAIEIGWRDTGTDENYLAALDDYPKNFTFTGKSTDSTYLIADQIIKFFPDSKVTAKRYRRGRMHPDAFAPVTECRGNFFSYRFVEGTLLSEGLDGPGIRSLLSWLEHEFWKEIDRTDPAFEGMCRDFYVEKTKQRLRNYLEARGLEVEASVSFRGHDLVTVSRALDTLSGLLTSGGIPSTLHGDLHADNVIVTGKPEDPFRLIDWREDFAGNLALGDRYYDLGKLRHTLTFPVRSMEERSFELKLQGRQLDLYHDRSPELEEAERVFESVVERKYSMNRLHVIESLIFINMAPLYDRELGDYLYYLGRTRLAETPDES